MEPPPPAAAWFSTLLRDESAKSTAITAATAAAWLARIAAAQKALSETLGLLVDAAEKHVDSLR
jgi:hypothetical protein